MPPTFFNNQGRPIGPGPRWGARTSAIPGATMLHKSAFDQVDRAIENLKAIPGAHQRGMNLLVRMIAYAHKGKVQEYSRGQVGGRAWTIPVSRHTSELYHGWRARQVRPGMWEVFNPVPHAFAVEHGLNPRATGEAVPRPILKQSGVWTIRWLARTRVGERFSQSLLHPLATNSRRSMSPAQGTAQFERYLDTGIH